MKKEEITAVTAANTASRKRLLKDQFLSLNKDEYFMSAGPALVNIHFLFLLKSLFKLTHQQKEIQ